MLTCAIAYASMLTCYYLMLLVSAMWATWAQWSPCTKSCGGGTKQRTRSCPNKSCPGQSDENKPCSAQICPIGKFTLYLLCQYLESFRYLLIVQINRIHNRNRLRVSRRWANKLPQELIR